MTEQSQEPNAAQNREKSTVNTEISSNNEGAETESIGAMMSALDARSILDDWVNNGHPMNSITSTVYTGAFQMYDGGPNAHTYYLSDDNGGGFYVGVDCLSGELWAVYNQEIIPLEEFYNQYFNSFSSTEQDQNQSPAQNMEDLLCFGGIPVKEILGCSKADVKNMFGQPYTDEDYDPNNLYYYDFALYFTDEGKLYGIGSNIIERFSYNGRVLYSIDYDYLTQIFGREPDNAESYNADVPHADRDFIYYQFEVLGRPVGFSLQKETFEYQSSVYLGYY